MVKSKKKSVTEIVVVFNPGAGNAQRVQIQRIVRQHFAGRQLELLEHVDEEDLADVLRPWLDGGVHLIIAAGGDGTVASLASAMIHSDIPLGILPFGTGNVLVRELGIPTDVDEAAKLLARKFDVRRLDALGVGDRAFLLSVSVGISAITMRKTAPHAKRRFGKLAYVWTFLANLIGLSRKHYELEFDGQSRSVQASEIIVLNSGILGSTLFRWGPDILPDDGILDLAFIRTRSILGFFRIVFGMLLRLKPEKNRMEVVRIRDAVQISSPIGLNVQGDGDLIGQTPVVIRLIPAAIKIAVPAK